MAELSNEKAKLVADLAAVNSQADAAKQENEALTVKLGRMQKMYEGAFAWTPRCCSRMGSRGRP